jgi:hypothetical protein
VGLTLLAVLILLLIGGLPTLNDSRRAGYRPVGIIGPILVIVLILLLMEYIPRFF